MSKNNLTAKQKAFVDQYLVDCNAMQAALRAGYRDGNIGRQLIAKNNVAYAIAEGQAQKAAEIGRTALDVIKDIQADTRSARESGDLKTALKGLELEGKHLGMFKDRLDVSGGLEFRGTIEIVKQ